MHSAFKKGLRGEEIPLFRETFPDPLDFNVVTVQLQGSSTWFEIMTFGHSHRNTKNIRFSSIYDWIWKLKKKIYIVSKLKSKILAKNRNFFSPFIWMLSNINSRKNYLLNY